MILYRAHNRVFKLTRLSLLVVTNECTSRQVCSANSKLRGRNVLCLTVHVIVSSVMNLSLDQICLLEHGEDYITCMPQAYVRLVHVYSSHTS